MPDLSPVFFAGPSDLPSAWRQKLSTSSHGLGLRDTLTDLGWRGEAIAAICLNLSADGSRVANGSFTTWGSLSENPIEFQANKLWEGTPRGTTIKIDNLQGQSFRFNSGQLQSDYLDQDQISMTVLRAGQEVNAPERPSIGVGNMALRAIAHLDKSSNRNSKPVVKITILAVPLSADEMAALSERTQHPAWPGIRILECKANLFPSPAETQWGCPIWPLIITRDRDATLSTTPSGQHLRHAIAEIMRTAALPTACTSRGALNEKGQTTLDDPDDPEIRRPSITWPATERPAADRGKPIIY